MMAGFDPAALSTAWANLVEDLTAAFVPELATPVVALH
jgi:hypothetical protein